MTKLAKEILGKFDEYRFYLGENMNIDGMVVLQYYREDGLTPVFIYFKDGLREEKYVSEAADARRSCTSAFSSEQTIHRLTSISCYKLPFWLNLWVDRFLSTCEWLTSVFLSVLVEQCKENQTKENTLNTSQEKKNRSCQCHRVDRHC